MSHSRTSKISGRSTISILPRHRSMASLASEVMCIAALWLSMAWCGHAATYYVDASRNDDSGVGTTWNTAKKTIQAAVNLTVNGDTVLVTNGVYNTGTTLTPGYALKNRLVVTNSITVRSINGPDVTIVEGSGTNWFNTSSAVRCVYMKRGVLQGFTLAKGTTFGAGLGSSDYYERRGGGVCMYNALAGTMVSNCLITACRAQGGGASYYGTLNNCTLAGNFASAGGGAFYGTLNDCVLSYNFATSEGGGACNGTLTHCTLSGNSVTQIGGGTYNSTLNDCTLSGNSAKSDGGGSYSSTLSHCTLSGNSAVRFGGGSDGGTLNNCTLSGNFADSGGGSYAGTLINCTLSGNSAKDKGGGSYAGTLNNCIVWGNRNTAGGSENFMNSAFFYSCSTPLPTGPGNIAVAPLFVAENDLRLQGGSSCINAGDNGYVAWASDIEGNPRILNGTVDMGAYEYAFVAAPVPVPYTWLDQYPMLLSLAGGSYETAALADADGDGHAAWQEYVAGTVPTNSESTLHALITVSNGMPWIAWSPDLGTARVYTVEGVTNLTDSAWGPTDAGSRFFRVKVGMP